ncbi:response regulator transcription factor [Carboxylicivirga taeanensis]|uniref:response regulator transcription factor n=1 Tax=Carboxylicivirga taeanensis TaxID=1416875 RepID=UPI003F6E22E9
MAKVLIAEQSHVIGLGLHSLVKNFQEVESIKIVAHDKECCSVLKHFEPDVLLVNTAFLGVEAMRELMELKKPESIVIHVFNTALPYDAPMNQISILDSKTSLHSKIEEALSKVRLVQEDMDNEELSPRERAILKEVALGLTNKEIAEKTYISTHTVISHRKNITRKLGIKTVSGLTVYAILNNIIQMEDIS